MFGEPGIGKTRLVSEFVEGVERVTALTGRALPYGEGITYWPLASMIKASAGITDDAPAAEAFEKLRLSCESEAVADLLAVALGLLGAAEGIGEDAELTWATLPGPSSSPRRSRSCSCSRTCSGRTSACSTSSSTSRAPAARSRC